MNIISTGVPPASLYQAYIARVDNTTRPSSRKTLKSDDTSPAPVKHAVRPPYDERSEHQEAWGIFARLLMSFAVHALFVAAGVVMMIVGNTVAGVLIAGFGVLVMVGGIVSVLTLLAKP